MSRKFFQRGGVLVCVMAAVLLADQLIKLYVKTHFLLHDSVRVTDWFYILFTENEGMAFGMQFFDKFFLTTFRIVAVAAIGWFFCRAVKAKLKPGFLVCVALILAGAAGNIIDCLLYGQIFTESTHAQLAGLTAFGQGYAPLFYGRVVDMFYFPIIETQWPGWLPLVGGERFVFFSPIFNLADASISCGVIAMILFYGKYVNKAFEVVGRRSA